MRKNIFIYVCNENKLKEYINDIKKYCIDNCYSFDEKNIFIADKEKLKSNLCPGDILILGELCMLGKDINEISYELYLLKNNNINLVIMKISKLLNRYLNNKKELIFDKIDLFVKLAYLELQNKVIKNKKRGRPKIDLPLDFKKIYNKWKKGEITAVKAMTLLSLSKTTFYKFVKEYESNIKNDSDIHNELIRGIKNTNKNDIINKNKFSHPNNAIIKNFDVYLRDKLGHKLINELVLKIGTKITVLCINLKDQLILIEYLFNNEVKRGFIKNDFRTIEYINEGNYINDCKYTPVYENELNEDIIYGKLFPYEKATILYKKNSKFCIVYNTKEGKNSKTGFINPMCDKKKFTYPNNAVIENFNVHLRNEKGRKMSIEAILKVGTKITILHINFKNQLVSIEYLFNGVVRQGYIKNSNRTIKYINEYNYKNKNMVTNVYEIGLNENKKVGKLFPNEKVTILYKNDFGTYIIYDTKKGKNSKTGYIL